MNISSWPSLLCCHSFQLSICYDRPIHCCYYCFKQLRFRLRIGKIRDINLPLFFLWSCSYLFVNLRLWHIFTCCEELHFINIFNFLITLLLFSYSCLHFLPIPLPHRSQTHLPPVSTLPFDFVHVSFLVVPENPSPHCPFPTPFWLLLGCSLQLQCLWLYFVCFFLLLIRFQLKVRSYGICPSPPGLFHLA